MITGNDDWVVYLVNLVKHMIRQWFFSTSLLLRGLSCRGEASVSFTRAAESPMMGSPSSVFGHPVLPRALITCNNKNRKVMENVKVVLSLHSSSNFSYDFIIITPLIMEKAPLIHQWHSKSCTVRSHFPLSYYCWVDSSICDATIIDWQ